jgi:hypothetical protein
LSVEDELELDDGAVAEPDLSVLIVAEPDTAPPEGAAVEPEGAVELEDDAEPDGVVVSRVTFGLLPSPQAVIRLALNARDTATANVFKFMDGLRGWDTGLRDANNGPLRPTRRS